MAVRKAMGESLFDADFRLQKLRKSGAETGSSKGGKKRGKTA